MSRYAGLNKDQLFTKVIELDQENTDLKESQNAFMMLLDSEVQKIREMKGLVRWWNAAKLMYNLIINYEEYRDEYLNNKK